MVPCNIQQCKMFSAWCLAPTHNLLASKGPGQPLFLPSVTNMVPASWLPAGSTPQLLLSLAVVMESWIFFSLHRLHIHQWPLDLFSETLTLPYDVKPQSFCHDHLNPAVSIANEATPSPLASHSASTQLIFMLSLCLQNQNHLGDSYLLPSSVARKRS